MKKLYKVYVCDDMGERVYSKTISADSLQDAEMYAFRWCTYVEAAEGWFTTYEAEEM